MESSENINLSFATAAIIGMLVLTVLLILFFVAYQRRLLKEQNARQAEREAHQKELLRASLESQEREQSRMAAELHDGAGAMLSTTRLYLQQLRLQPDSTQAKDWLKMAENMLRDTVTTIRTISQNLQPAELESIGLVGAVRTLTDTLEKTGAVQVHTDLHPTPELGPEAQLLLYRMAQELINNAIKHAQARTLTVRLTADEAAVRLEVSDDGVGFDASQLPEGRRSMGLKTLESRSGLLNGTLTRKTAPGQGTQTKITVPILTNPE